MNKGNLSRYTSSKGFHFFYTSLSLNCVTTEICQGRGKSRIQVFVCNSVFPLFPCVYVLTVDFHTLVFCESSVLKLGHKSQKMVLKDSLFICKMLRRENEIFQELSLYLFCVRCCLHHCLI